MIQLNHQQVVALDRIHSFLNSENQIFILKGYAGTGKTTLIKRLIQEFESNGKSFGVMAPTGRAAKVLRDITKSQYNKDGYGYTIHKTIYNYEDVKIIEDDEQSTEGLSYKYLYPIRRLKPSGHISIVDEASMVPDSESKHELFKFGTDRLLPDLLTYTGAPGSNKIIFVGDPAQLPPVVDNNSHALTKKYFDQLGIPVEQYEMTEVVRQKSDSNILKNAIMIRSLLECSLKERNRLAFDYGSDFQRLSEVDVTGQYVADFSDPSLDSGVVISFTNKQCLSYNQRIRERYFPDKKSVQPEDILMVVKNSYGNFGLELFNGDLVQVTKVTDSTERQGATIYVNENGKKVKKHFSFTFRDIVIKVPSYDDEFPVKIIDSMLDDYTGSLSTNEMKALFVNFNMRFEEEQKVRKANGLLHYKRGSKVYKDMLKNDPYINAINVKYGYAITCHKAQGGEWNKAYVNFQNRLGLNDDHLRWIYTAITRGKEHLYAINPPNISPLNNITFSTISPLNNIPSEALDFGDPPATPYHGLHTHPAKRLLYHEVTEKLKNTDYQLNRVDSTEYQEMYYIQDDDQEIRVDALHNAAGVIKPFKIIKGKPKMPDELLKILNEPFNQEIQLSYVPSSDVLANLYYKAQAALSHTDGRIAGVVERPENYFVNYYFRLNGTYASIKFNFRANEEIRRAEPKIMDMRQREVLLKIIDQMT